MMVQGPSFGIASFGLAFLSKTPQLRVAGVEHVHNVIRTHHTAIAKPAQVLAAMDQQRFRLLEPMMLISSSASLTPQARTRTSRRCSSSLPLHAPLTEIFFIITIRVEDLSGCGHPNYGYRRDKPTANAIATGIDSTEGENITPAPFGFPSVGLKNWGIGIQVRHSKGLSGGRGCLSALAAAPTNPLDLLVPSLV